MAVESLISDIVARLKRVKGAKAIVLGGSYAAGTQRPDSDIDIGIYYGNEGLEIAHIKDIAIELNDFPNPVVTNRGDWGKWVNGGAWLTIKGQRVDFLYRDIGFVSQTIDDCNKGLKQSDYYQQPPYGFHSYIYCAEIKVCKILHDPEGIIEALKSKVAAYPKLLKQAVVQGFMWEAEFSLAHCKKSAERNEVFIVAGCLTRIANDFVQVLYALNETYFLSEKGLYKEERVFNIKPQDFMLELDKMVGRIGETKPELMAAVSMAEALFEELKMLCGDLYRPRFR